MKQWSRREFLWTGLGVVASPTVLSCSSPTEPDSPRLSARPGMPTLAPTPGLSSLGLGGTRDGVLYVPGSYDSQVPTPLFVALHGATGSSQDWASYHARAEQRGMVLLAPDSRAQTWDLMAEGEFGRDVQFLDRALAHTFSRCRIDPGRICLAGFSDGASYALALGLANGDLFRHAVAYSPGFLLLPPAPPGRPRVFVSHGNYDPILSVRQTRNVIVPTLEEAGYDVTYRQFEGGHEVPAAVSEEALDWFLAGG